MSSPKRDLPPILPLGTAVVTRFDQTRGDSEVIRRRGAVAVIVRVPLDPDHGYRVRFPGGEEATLHRREMVVLSHFQEGENAADAMAEYDLYQHVIYRCVIGSRAYGLDTVESDHDRRGVYLPPADLHWSLFGLPEQLDNDATQECYWELQKFLVLALKANPNVLEVLYSPMVEHVSPMAEEMLALRPAFLSKLVYQTYNGYVLSQFKKLETDLRNHGQIKNKHAMHLIRLLLAGIATLREGVVPVRVGEHRDRLLAIRHEQVPWDEINAWRLDLHREFDEAFARTKLPDRPDYAAVNAFLVRARRSMT